MTRKSKNKTKKSLKHDNRKSGWGESLAQFQNKKGISRLAGKRQIRKEVFEE